jgi:hypothetical protein
MMPRHALTSACASLLRAEPPLPAAANASKVTRLRTLIATLKEGASFCKRLTVCLAQVQVLLASPVAAVVHDAIVFLTTCK